MSVVNQRLEQVTLGDLKRFDVLCMVPLIADTSSKLDYVLLDSALADGTAVIDEVSESGSVPELLFRNKGSKPVLVVDGQELLGAKQNRIVNISIMVPAKTDLKIPVSCVEAGRWDRAGTSFRSASRTHFANGRARKTREVNFSLKSSGTRTADQGRVWSEIDSKAKRLNAPSATGASAAMYDTHRSSIDEYLDAFPPQKNQVGTIFLIEGSNHGIDLFDCPDTAVAMHPKLVESYALDAIDFDHGVRFPETDEMLLARSKAFLKQIEDAQKQSFSAIGMGKDVRFEGKQLTGGALEVDDQCTHLCAFRLDHDIDDDDFNDDEARVSPSHGHGSRIRRNVNRRR